MVNLQITSKKILVFLFITFLAYNYLILTDYTPISPDESSYIFFSTNFAKTGDLFYSENLNEMYNTNMFAPRNMVYSNETKVVAPQGFLGSFYIFSIFNMFINIKFLFPLFGVMGLIFLYYIIKIIFNKKIALVSTILSSFFPAYWIYSGKINPDLPSLIFLLGGFLYYLKFNNKNYINLFISGLFLGISIIIRYTSILPIILFLILFNFNINSLKHSTIKTLFNKKYLKNFFFIIIIILPVIFLIFLFNKTLFGGYLITGYYLNPIKESTGFSLFIIPTITGHFLKNVFINFYKYFFLLNALYFIFILLGIINSALEKKFLIRKFIIFNVIFLIIYILYYGGAIFYGYGIDNISIGHSYVRYYLPIYLLLIPFGVKLILEKFNRKLIIFVLFSIIFFSFFNLFISNDESNIPNTINNMNKYQTIRTELLEKIPSKTIVFTRYWDKLIFPERVVANYFINLPENQISESIKLSNSLLKNNQEVYFLFEEYNKELLHSLKFPFFEDFKNEFYKNNICMEKINDIIYKLGYCNNETNN